jgi:hypothetical protein
MLTARTFSRPTRAALVIVAVAMIAVVPMLWYLASPLFLTQVVSEALPTQAGPMMVTRGQFGVIDAIHKGEGEASILSLPGGERVLRLGDGFRVTNGPDLYVYLSSSPMPRSSAELHDGGAFEVAQLKGNVGAQNYELPADLDLARFRSVVIYCRRFTTVFSTAELGS